MISVRFLDMHQMTLLKWLVSNGKARTALSLVELASNIAIHKTDVSLYMAPVVLQTKQEVDWKRSLYVLSDFMPIDTKP